MNGNTIKIPVIIKYGVTALFIKPIILIGIDKKKASFFKWYSLKSTIA